MHFICYSIEVCVVIHRPQWSVWEIIIDFNAKQLDREYTTPYTYTTIFVQTPLLFVFILHNYDKKQTQQIIITPRSMRFVFWLFKWIKRKIPRQLIGFIPLQVHISILINTTHDNHQQNSNCITIHSEMESKSIRNTASISLNWIVFALNLCDTFGIHLCIQLGCLHWNGIHWFLCIRTSNT